MEDNEKSNICYLHILWHTTVYLYKYAVISSWLQNALINSDRYFQKGQQVVQWFSSDQVMVVKLM